MCRRFDPLFWHSGDWTRSFWGTFSHPPTPKRSLGVLKLPILTEFDLFGPKFYFSLDLFGSNFQRPAAHPHQFSDRVPPLRGGFVMQLFYINFHWAFSFGECKNSNLWLHQESYFCTKVTCKLFNVDPMTLTIDIWWHYLLKSFMNFHYTHTCRGIFGSHLYLMKNHWWSYIYILMIYWLFIFAKKNQWWLYLLTSRWLIVMFAEELLIIIFDEGLIMFMHIAKESLMVYLLKSISKSYII